MAERIPGKSRDPVDERERAKEGDEKMMKEFHCQTRRTVTWWRLAGQIKSRWQRAGLPLAADAVVTVVKAE